MKNFFRLCVITLCFLCSGCGFHMRSASTFQPQLKTIYFSSSKAYSALSIQLKGLLTAMGAKLVNHPSDARYALIITRDFFTNSRPDVVDTTLPTTINYSYSATATIKDTQLNKTVATQSFFTSQTLVLNVNQVYTANANELVKQQLNRRIISLIYYWLISIDIKMALQDADHTQPTSKHTAS